MSSASPRVSTWDSNSVGSAGWGQAQLRLCLVGTPAGCCGEESQVKGSLWCSVSYSEALLCCGICLQPACSLLSPFPSQTTALSLSVLHCMGSLSLSKAWLLASLLLGSVFSGCTIFFHAVVLL